MTRHLALAVTATLFAACKPTPPDARPPEGREEEHATEEAPEVETDETEIASHEANPTVAPTQEHGGGWREVAIADLTPSERAQFELAGFARDGLLEELGGALRSQVQAHGLVAAVPFCSEQAGSISATTAELHGVRLGRTSHRLRNPENAAPAWAQEVVARAESAPHAFVGPEDVVGVLMPLPVGEPCVACHGDVSGFAPELASAIASAYPTDEATGFAVGELRGWVWAEVDPINADEASAP